MGTEMIAKAADGFERKQRESLEQLEKPNLFTCAPHVSGGVVVTPEAGHVFRVDARYRFVRRESDVIVVQGISPVGKVTMPPPSLLHAMNGAESVVCGRVSAVSALTGQADVVLE